MLGSHLPKCIVYNLGYLPGADKSITTVHDTTIKSLKQALDCVVEGGAIFITCYPGHAAGKIETKAVQEFCKTLDPKIWNVCTHSWLNRNNHPELIVLQKAV